MPTGCKLEPPDGGRIGNFSLLQPATPDLLAIAKRNWPEVDPEEFHRRGRKVTHIASGDEYRVVTSYPFNVPTRERQASRAGASATTA